MSEAPTYDRDAVLADYRLGWRSRHTSLLGRREVLTGKAKFGIFGDGKELAQLALAHAFRPGDFRAGYYRDQTLVMALGLVTVEQFFAQLYAHPDLDAEPCSAGRSMTAHFATHLVDENGDWRELAQLHNSSADLSPTGGQMPRLVGLAQASKLYRELPGLRDHARFSDHGNEIAWGTIGNASTAEGMFWEAINAACVLQVPMLASIWDDGYGISVPNEHQIAKGDLSALLSGFARQPGTDGGCELFTVRGWDYPALRDTYARAAAFVRQTHIPVVVHVTEVTQPQGHSTSGSHERYKSAERLDWERELDCLTRFRTWILGAGLASADELDAIEAGERRAVSEAKSRAWDAFRAPLERERSALLELERQLVADLPAASPGRPEVERLASDLGKAQLPMRRELLVSASECLLATRNAPGAAREALAAWRSELTADGLRRYGSDLHSETAASPLRVASVAAAYADDAPLLNGFEILNACFDAQLARRPELVAFGEDLGRLGDVNQGFAGLQEKYGALRVADVGIRECTIMGQAIGLAMRGLRPIAEIQYLDYILYGLQILSDDLASLRYRTRGRQKAPAIIRTRGHRLEGIWHSGSPMAGIINLVRGIWVCVPRNMTQAAGMYNTLLAGDDPAIVVEVLNGYRQKERLPANVGDFKVPLGVPEILRPGSDITIVTYGACCRIVIEAAELLASVGVDAEVIDVQTLLPFDLPGVIVASVKKTNRLLLVDEDVPGGASAFMLQQVIERQGAFDWLDAAPRTVTAKEHRPPYGSDGDYFAKPNREEIFAAAYAQLREARPQRHPAAW
jgi:pyruvate/2-oxoglutarate/acetoin dehydrogenase E1 component/TPP-dependent pyruvate/acetoin dehydrogenase alpha subunit